MKKGVCSVSPLVFFSRSLSFLVKLSLCTKKTTTRTHRKRKPAAAGSVSVVFKAGWNKSSGDQQVEQMGAMNYLQGNLERVLSNSVSALPVVGVYRPSIKVSLYVGVEFDFPPKQLII